MTKNPEPDEKGSAILISILEVVREQAEVVRSAQISMAALLQVFGEKFPDLGPAYERYREVSERTSPIAVANRQLVAQLDEIIAALKES